MNIEPDYNRAQRPLRLLMVTSDKYPFHRPAAKAIYSRELGDRGHVIDWLVQAADESKEYGELPLGNGVAFVAPSKGGGAWYGRILRHALSFRNDLRMFGLVRKGQYDLIQIKDKYIAGILALVVQLVWKVPVFYWVAWPHVEASMLEAKGGTARYRWLYYARAVLLKPLLYKMLLPMCKHVFVQSEQMKRDFRDQGVDEDLMTAVPSSIDLAAVPYHVEGKCVNPFSGVAGTRIVYVGTLMSIRKLGFLIRAFKTVLSVYPTAVLYFVGKGELESDQAMLEAEATALGVRQNIVFTGYLPMDEVWEYVRGADVCASPYYPTPILMSTSPTKLVEYMAMGKPVVCNDHPEQADIMTRSHAGLCVGWNEEEFGAAITRICSDLATWRQRGLLGRKFIEETRTNKLMADVVEGVYYKQLSGD